MKLISLQITDKLVSQYYTPVLRAVYTTGIFDTTICTREVMCCKASGIWYFLEGTSDVIPSPLAKQLASEFEKLVTVRRSSFPPPRVEVE